MQTIILGLISGSIYALIALGLALVYKTTRALNFAQVEIGTLAIYATWWVSVEQGKPWWMGAIAAIVVGGFIGLVFDRMIMRHMMTAPRVTVVVATVGLFSTLLGLEAVWFAGSIHILPPPFEAAGITIAGVVVSPAQQLAIVVVALIAAGLAAFFRYTDFGVSIVAFADDPTAAQLMGVRRHRVSMFTWATAGALSAIAVLLIQPTVGVLAPGAFSGLFVGGLTACLLGGLDSLPGAFVGGLLVGVAEAVVKANLTTVALPGVNTVAMMVIVLGVLLVRPRGVMGKVA